MTLCECGCGGEAKPGNRFIYGHNKKGKTKENDESTRRQAEKLTGRTKEEYEYLKRAGEKRKGRTKENYEGTRRQSEKMKGRTKENNEGIRKGAEKRTGRTKENYESIKRQAEKMIGDKNPAKRPEVREKISKHHQGVKFGEEHCKHLSEAQLKRFQEHPISEKTKRKSSNTFKQLWQNPEFAEKMIKSWNKKPNKLEKLIYNILQNILPNEYKINVEGEIMTLGRKIPDFVNVNGQKKVIEFNGCYYHSCPICFSDSKIDGLKKTEERINLFKKYGYETLVIWEHELEDMEAVVNKILEFHNLPSLSTTIQSKLE